MKDQSQKTQLIYNNQNQKLVIKKDIVVRYSDDECTAASVDFVTSHSSSQLEANYLSTCTIFSFIIIKTSTIFSLHALFSLLSL